MLVAYWGIIRPSKVTTLTYCTQIMGAEKRDKEGGPLLINSYLLHCRHWAVLSGSYAWHKLKCTHSEKVEIWGGGSEEEE